MGGVLFLGFVVLFSWAKHFGQRWEDSEIVTLVL